MVFTVKQDKNKNIMGSNHRLRVAVDFGTTFSGVAWASFNLSIYLFYSIDILVPSGADSVAQTHSAQPEEVIVISTWPGVSKSSVQQKQTIRYSRDMCKYYTSADHTHLYD